MKKKLLYEACYEPYYETRQYEYRMPIDCGYYGGPEDIGCGAGNSGITSFDRDKNKNSDMLDRAKFVSKTAFRQVEGWPTGRPEFKVIISYIEKIGDNYQTKTITKILTKDDWTSRYGLWVNLKTKKIHLPILVWDKAKYGDSIKYTWIEQDDSSKKVELSISTSSKFDDGSNSTITGSTKVTITPEVDEAGEAVIRYDDATAGVGTEYNTGIVRFWVNQ